MIASLNGIITAMADTYIILDVHGVGYQVFMTQPDLLKLPGLNDPLQVTTYHYIREDTQVLYGFVNAQDKSVFSLLTTVSGIGPKIAMGILSSLPSKDLIQAIIKEDTRTLGQISGLGAKKASRLIIELKDKLPKLFEIPIDGQSGLDSKPNLGDLQQDLTLALKALGYSNEEIKSAFKRAEKTLTPQLSLEDGIKILLRVL